MQWVLRTESDPTGLTASAMAAIREVEPNMLLTEGRPMTDVVESTLAHSVLLSHMLAGMGDLGAGGAGVGAAGGKQRRPRGPGGGGLRGFLDGKRR